MRHVVIVGGGAALAQPLIDHFFAAGYRVTAVCRNTAPDRPEATIAGAEEPFKVVWEDQVNIEEAVDDIDVLVTLSGKTIDGKLDDLTWAAWEGVLSAALIHPAMTLGSLLPKVKAGGNVVVVGSIVGSLGGVGCANYAAAKAGLVGLVRAAANEFPRLHINLLEMGYTDVGMGARLPPKVKERVLKTIPLGRFGTAEDFVHAVEFLASTKYCSGNVLTLAGGLHGVS